MSVTRSQTINALLSTTADAYYKAGLVHDGVFLSNPTFAALKAKGIKQDGGNQIQVNLMYGKNETVDSYSRYGLIDTAPQDGIEPAYYSWAQYAGSVSIDGLSESQNSGKPMIQKLLREKVKQLTMSFSERMNEDLWRMTANATLNSAVTGNGGLDIISIPMYVQKAPSTASIDVGGIDQSAKSYWRNKVADSGTESSGTFLMLGREMRNMYNQCTQGSGGSPDLLIANQNTFEAYETGLDVKVRYAADDVATAGFESIKFKSAKLMWDAHVPDPTTPYDFDHASYAPTSQGAMFFLNTKFLELCTMPGKDFAPLGFQQPPNQDARTGLWIFYGQLTCSNRRKQGLLHDITTTITS